MADLPNGPLPDVRVLKSRVQAILEEVGVDERNMNDLRKRLQGEYKINLKPHVAALNAIVQDVMTDPAMKVALAKAAKASPAHRAVADADLPHGPLPDVSVLRPRVLAILEEVGFATLTTDDLCKRLEGEYKISMKPHLDALIAIVLDVMKGPAMKVTVAKAAKAAKAAQKEE
jgi:hypothetical protein